MKKKFLAKLLVLCMAVSMLPAAAISVGAAGTEKAAAEASDTCTITADTATGGSVYVVKADASVEKLTGTYTMTGDTTIRLVPEDGYEMVKGSSSGGSYYTYTSGSETGYVYITSADTKITLTNYAAGTTFKVYPVFEKTSSSGGSSSGGSSSSPDKVTVEEPSTSGGTTTVEVKVEQDLGEHYQCDRVQEGHGQGGRQRGGGRGQGRDRPRH